MKTMNKEKKRDCKKKRDKRRLDSTAPKVTWLSKKFIPEEKKYNRNKYKRRFIFEYYDVGSG